jgi:uncharacterized membrane protein
MGLGLGFLGGLNGNGIGGIGGLMGADPVPTAPATDSDITRVVSNINGIITSITTFTLAIMALIILCYSVWIGFKFMKAEDDGKRKEAKTHLIYCVVGFLAMGVMWTITSLLKIDSYTITVADGGVKGLSDIYAIVAQVVSGLLNMVILCVSMFSVYIGWRFISAEDEGKRKSAKAQLIYAIIGVVSIFALRALTIVVINGLSSGLVK